MSRLWKKLEALQGEGKEVKEKVAKMVDDYGPIFDAEARAQTAEKAVKNFGKENIVSVVGSRTIEDKDLIYEELDNLHAANPIKKIVSGGASGVDSIAAQWAKERGVELEEIIPDWSKGMGAGLERNTDIVDRADKVVVFWDGESRGTLDSITKSKNAGKALTIIKGDGTREAFNGVSEAVNATGKAGVPQNTYYKEAVLRKKELDEVQSQLIAKAKDLFEGEDLIKNMDEQIGEASMKHIDLQATKRGLQKEVDTIKERIYEHADKGNISRKALIEKSTSLKSAYRDLSKTNKELADLQKRMSALTEERNVISKPILEYRELLEKEVDLTTEIYGKGKKHGLLKNSEIVEKLRLQRLKDTSKAVHPKVAQLAVDHPEEYRRILDNQIEYDKLKQQHYDYELNKILDRKLVENLVENKGGGSVDVSLEGVYKDPKTGEEVYDMVSGTTPKEELSTYTRSIVEQMKKNDPTRWEELKMDLMERLDYGEVMEELQDRLDYTMSGAKIEDFYEDGFRPLTTFLKNDLFLTCLSL